MAVQIALYANQRDNHPKTAVLEWEELAAALLTTKETDCAAKAPCVGKECPAKNGEAWSPVVIAPPKTRANENVDAVTMAVFDLDDFTWAEVEALVERISGLDWVLHGTHSHRPPEKNRLRLVFPISRPVQRNEWPVLWSEAIRRFGIRGDTHARDPSRIYFLPSVFKGGPQFAVRSDSRLVLDVNEFLSGVTIPALTERPSFAGAVSRPATKPVEQVDMVELRKIVQRHLQNESAEYQAAFKRMLDGEPLAQEGSRDVTVHYIANMLGFILPADTPIESVVELMRPSLNLMDGGPSSGGAWVDKVPVSFSRGLEQRLGKEAIKDDFKKKLMTKLGFKSATSAPKPPTASGAAPEGEPEDKDAWLNLLAMEVTKTGPQARSMGMNADLIFRCADEWKGVFRFNEVTKTIHVVGGPLEPTETHLSVLATNVSTWLQMSDFKLRLSEIEVRSQILANARRNSFNPLQDYLLGVRPSWDGDSRCDTFLERYFGARVADPELGDITSHVRRVSARWLISAVARGIKPGCKVDTVLVLEGAQGLKKSSALKALGGDFFADSQLNLADKDSKMLAAQSWIVELMELASLRRSETDAYKGFLSAQEDKFRPPYGAAIEKFDRMCVFVGTTNEEHYLQDMTGNRRFLPITCGEIDLDAIVRDRDQIWAEAVARYQRGEIWWFSPEEQEVANQQNASRLRAPSKAQMIWSWWVRQPLDQRPLYLKTVDIALDVLHLTAAQLDDRAAESIDRAMRFLKFKHAQVKEGDSWERVWVPAENLREATRVTGRPNYLKVVKEGQ